MSRRSHKNYRRCGSRITFSGAFPANPYPGQMGLAPKYPLVESLPATVVNGHRWRLASDGKEYLGVGGAWVPQDSVTMTRWTWKGVFRNEGLDWVDCGRPAWLSQLRPSVDVFTIATTFSKSGTDWGRIICLGPTNGSYDQFAIVCAGSDTQNQISSLVGGSGSWSNPPLPALVESAIKVVTSFGLSQSKTFLNGSIVGLVTNGTYVNETDNIFIGCASGGGDNFEGDICCVEIYASANDDGSLNGLTLIDRYDFDKWDGSSSGQSEKGYPFTVTDGAPYTGKSFAWVPQ